MNIYEAFSRWFYGSQVEIRNTKVNVAETAHKMLVDIKKNGFNRVRVERMEYENVWSEHYAIFILQFDEYIHNDYYRHNDYTDTVFRDDDLQKDFKKHLETLFPECTINIYEGCYEFEIISNGYQEWWAEHADAVEEFADKNWDANKKQLKTGPVVFVP